MAAIRRGPSSSPSSRSSLYSFQSSSPGYHSSPTSPAMEMDSPTDRFSSRQDDNQQPPAWTHLSQPSRFDNIPRTADSITSPVNSVNRDSPGSATWSPRSSAAPNYPHRADPFAYSAGSSYSSGGNRAYGNSPTQEQSQQQPQLNNRPFSSFYGGSNGQPYSLPPPPAPASIETDHLGLFSQATHGAIGDSVNNLSNPILSSQSQHTPTTQGYATTSVQLALGTNAPPVTPTLGSAFSGFPPGPVQRPATQLQAPSGTPYSNTGSAFGQRQPVPGRFTGQYTHMFQPAPVQPVAARFSGPLPPGYGSQHFSPLATHHSMYQMDQPYYQSMQGNSRGTNDKPYRCECGQPFARNHDLKRHKKIHLEIKPYPCTFCPKAFSRKDALKRHRCVKKCGGELGQNPDYKNPDYVEADLPSGGGGQQGSQSAGHGNQPFSSGSHPLSQDGSSSN